MIIEIKELNMVPQNIEDFNIINKYIDKTKNYNLADTKKFLLENKNNTDITILIRNCYSICINNNKLVTSTFFNELIPFIYKNIFNLKFIILTNDWWIRGPILHTNMINIIFKPPSNINVLTFSSEKVISKFHNVSYSSYKNNIHKLLHHTASEKNIQKYNKNPKNQISVFGNYNNDYYPLRNKILVDNPNVIKYGKLSMDIFLATINDSFACFTTSVNPFNFSTNKNESSNCILLKVFEILAGGSLLLYPKDEEQYLNEIGLYDKQNCWLIDMNKNIPEQCSYITDPNNRDELEKIRFAGYNHAITNLTTEKLLKPLIEYFEKIN